MNFTVYRTWTHGKSDKLAMFANYTDACLYAKDQAKLCERLTTNLAHEVHASENTEDPGIIRSFT